MYLYLHLCLHLIKKVYKYESKYLQDGHGLVRVGYEEPSRKPNKGRVVLLVAEVGCKGALAPSAFSVIFGSDCRGWADDFFQIFMIFSIRPVVCPSF
jgi:hypothetical protein